MVTVRAPINGDVLRQAIEQARTTPEALAHQLKLKPDAVEAWVREDASPTVNQLRTMSKLLRKTPATFFLSVVPEDAAPRPPEFRLHSDPEHDVEVARELSKAADRRDVMMNLAPSPANALSDALWTGDEPADVAAARTRVAMGLEPHESPVTGSPTSAGALAAWIDVFNRSGILVFQMSRVKKEKLLGVSVYNDDFPYILLNGASKPEVRIFTLAHELGHLVSQSGGVCTVWDDEVTEVRCNAFAAEFLLPAEQFMKALGNDEPLAAASRMAKVLRVSQSAIVVRFRTLGLITQEQLERQLEVARVLSGMADQLEADQRASRKNRGGPPYHRVHLRNLGRQYFDTVTEALEDGRITLLDASYFIEAKLPTLDRMREERALGSQKVMNEIFA